MEKWQKEYVIHATIGIMIIIITAVSYYFVGMDVPTPFRSYCIGVGSGILFTGITKALLIVHTKEATTASK